MTVRLTIPTLIAIIVLATAASFIVARMTQPDAADAARDPSLTVLRQIKEGVDDIDQDLGYTSNGELGDGTVIDLLKDIEQNTDETCQAVKDQFSSCSF